MRFDGGQNVERQAATDVKTGEAKSHRAGVNVMLSCMTDKAQPSDQLQSDPKTGDPDAACMRGAALVEEGKLHEAAEIFRTLSERTDLADGHRAVMAVNLATVYDKMGHVDTAIQTYEYASTITLRNYVWTEEGRAEYLFKRERYDEAIGVWEHILTLSFLPDEVVKRVEQNLAVANEKRA
ncbi:MAG: tetratricopeptide repeat protein [Anaerolineae bacterium]|nr:tetratricopeptide repeat protein [Phycisphaerae bacterium]